MSTLLLDPSSPSLSVQSESSFADTVEHLEDELANLNRNCRNTHSTHHHIYRKIGRYSRSACPSPSWVISSLSPRTPGQLGREESQRQIGLDSILLPKPKRHCTECGGCHFVAFHQNTLKPSVQAFHTCYSFQASSKNPFC
jgi:hypothetical protein